eukprot:CAMPEP_0177661668 /NCGR_PEP_ID=MMETSP0447-20121125/18827_1 /TAXON_ID=0 /ORGANISM="Stygamoeba regulata, Strain BSH-02190019" /LENGTH=328 /DNA_ID=CAMNT_0019167077 /DNA_START=91 /DNA_END=1077 /DNA_ORIENTATION=-
MRDFVPNSDASSASANQSLSLVLGRDEIRFTAQNMAFTEQGRYVLPVWAISAYSAEWISPTASASSPEIENASSFKVSLEVNLQELVRRNYAPPIYRVGGDRALERRLNYFTFEVDTVNFATVEQFLVRNRVEHSIPTFLLKWPWEPSYDIRVRRMLSAVRDLWSLVLVLTFVYHVYLFLPHYFTCLLEDLAGLLFFLFCRPLLAVADYLYEYYTPLYYLMWIPVALVTWPVWIIWWPVAVFGWVFARLAGFLFVLGAIMQQAAPVLTSAGRYLKVAMQGMRTFKRLKALPVVKTSTDISSSASSSSSSDADAAEVVDSSSSTKSKND